MTGSELSSKSSFLIQAGAILLWGSRKNLNWDTITQIWTRMDRKP